MLNAQSRYTSLETLILAFVMTIQKLEPYFQSHTVEVVTGSSNSLVLHKLDLNGRTAAWAAIVLSVFSDSTLFVNQVHGNLIASNLVMSSYLEKVQQLMKKFKKIEVKQLPRGRNYHVDAVINVTSFIKSSYKQTIPIEFLIERSIVKDEKQQVLNVHQGTNN